MLHPLLPLAWTVVVDVVAWAALHTMTGYAAHRLPDRWLTSDRWLLRPRRFEYAGRWYRNHLRIDGWKDAVPDAGDLFAGGISKRRLPGLDETGLTTFARETRRAEIAHWWAMGCAPFFVLWNPPIAAALLLGYGVIVNAPFIAIQRYNRFRTIAILERCSRRRAATSPTSAATGHDPSR